MSDGDAPSAGGEPVLTPLEGIVGYRLRRLQARWITHWGHWFRALGVSTTPVQGGILLLIRANPGISQVALARLLQVEAPTLMQALTPLMRAGLVARVRSPRDGRAFELRLSEAGASVADLIEADMLRQEEDLLAGLTAAERKTFLALLDKALSSADAATAALSAEACPPAGETSPLPRA
ncbi:DNA-binding MarR family transcriptional regulator [Amorphus suaedae]